MSKIDRRISHTKYFLKEALIHLLTQKPITKISITELCAKADINRNTFYSHYNYIEEVLMEIEDDIFNELSEIFKKNTSVQNSSNLINEICHYLKENPKYANVILNDNDNGFSARLIQFSYEQNLNDWHQIKKWTNETTAEMFFRFTLSGTNSILKYWIEHGFKESCEEIASMIMKLSMHGMDGFITK